jgi:translocation and assembly module TamB
MRLESRSGHFQVTGWLEHADLALRQLDMAVSARDFSALHTSFADAIVSADVAVRGSLQEISATGSITVPSAHLRLENIPGGGQKAVQPWELTVPGVYGPGPKALSTEKGPAAGPPGGDDPLPFLQADLRLDMPRNVWVQGPSTAVELSGNLRVTKALRAPFILSGSIETVRGYAGYYGKKFNIETGRVTFTGTPEINPMLDVTVQKKISEYLVSIHVEGRTQQPKLVLSSDPELPQADILSLLVLGKTTERLTKSERNSLGSGAGQLAGNIIGGQLEQTLGRSLGLDTIEIDSGESLGSGTVKAGRYVTQDLFLSVGREVGDDNNTSVGVEYSINRRLKVRGSSTSQGETALDFFWRLDY